MYHGHQGGNGGVHEKEQRPLPAEVSRQGYHGVNATASARVAGIRAPAQQHLSIQQDKRVNPAQGIGHSGAEIGLPEPERRPKHPLEKPMEGRYHLVRFIRSDCRLNIFGEMFTAPPETRYEHVVATIDVKEQKLKLFLDTIQVEEYNYRMR
jgi:hypothetical protein